MLMPTTVLMTARTMFGILRMLELAIAAAFGALTLRLRLGLLFAILIRSSGSVSCSGIGSGPAGAPWMTRLR